jgi:hypothetical protein
VCFRDLNLFLEHQSMALVHDNIGEFAFFPRDRAFSSDLLSQPSAHNSNNSLHSTTEMDYNSQLASLPRTTYDLYPVTTSYAASSMYYGAHKNPANSLKVGDEGSMPRPTPSASPSSISQTFDQPLSALSSTSGASAQSAASSVGGSPYARPTQQMPFHDKWSDPLQGLGISSSIRSGDFPGYDPSRQDFVGEYQDSSSSLSSAGPSLSSISLAPALQEFPLNMTSQSGSSRDSQTERMGMDAIMREVSWTTEDVAPLTPTSALISMAGSRSVLPGTTQDRSLFPCLQSNPTDPLLGQGFHQAI